MFVHSYDIHFFSLVLYVFSSVFPSSPKLLDCMMSMNLGGPPGMFPPIYGAGAGGADDNVVAGGTIGVEIHALPEHQAAHDETMSNRVQCIPDYRRRIAAFITFIKTDYRAYYDQVVSI